MIKFCSKIQSQTPARKNSPAVKFTCVILKQLTPIPVNIQSSNARNSPGCQFVTIDHREAGGAVPANQTVSSRDAATEPPGTDSRRVWIAGTAPPAGNHGTFQPSPMSKYVCRIPIHFSKIFDISQRRKERRGKISFPLASFASLREQYKYLRR